MKVTSSWQEVRVSEGSSYRESTVIFLSHVFLAFVFFFFLVSYFRVNFGLESGLVLFVFPRSRFRLLYENDNRV